MHGIRHVILDRDGVLNVEAPAGGYCDDPGKFVWIPGSLQAVARLHASGIRVSVATNQSGVGRGDMSEGDLARVHDCMLTEAAEAGGSIAAVFSCTHAPWEQCSCRKPLPGLVHAAVDATSTDLSATCLIGDDVRDVQAGLSAGVRVMLVRTGKGKDCEAAAREWSVPIYDDLAAAVGEIVDNGFIGAIKQTPQMRVRAAFDQHLTVVRQAAGDLPDKLGQVIDAVARCIGEGHKVLACGNGGSASDAQHLTAELVGRFHRSRRALPAISLTCDPSTFTAVANDYGYEQVFARQVEALASPGDLLIAISTSGASANVVRAAQTARLLGCTVVAMTGASAGELGAHADILIQSPSAVVARIQEIHGLCVHAIAEGIDERFAPTVGG